MAQRSRFQAPRTLSSLEDVQRALVQVQESLDAATRSSALLRVYTKDFGAVAGGFHRVSAPSAGLDVRLPKAGPDNLAEPVILHLEGTLGDVVVWAAPGDLVNGELTATFSVDGVIALWSNGVSRWAGVAQTPAESPAGAALDAEYVLGAAHASLPNGRVATDSTEIDVDLTVANVASWALRTASVVLGKLQNLTGLSVLGRAANSTGVMAAITAGTGGHYLRSNAALTSLEWGSPASTSVVASGVELQRAALTGAVSAAQNSNATSFAGIQDNGVAETAQPNLNFANTTSISFAGTQDAPNSRITVTATRAALTGAIEASANSNATLFSAGASGAGLTGGGTAVLTVGAGTHITVNADDVAVNLTTLVPAIDSTSIIANGTVLERAALTGFVSATQNSNATSLAGLRVNGTLQTARGFLNVLNTNTTSWATVDDSANNEVELRVNVQMGNWRDNGSLETAQAFINVLNNDAIELGITQDAGNQELELRATYVGTTSEVTIASATGNLGTINIAALACGGSVRVTSASSAFSIEGFTAKTDGFWFDFLCETGTTNHCTLLDEDATATAANRLSLPMDSDMSEQGQIRGRFFYRNSRWNFSGANQQVVGLNPTNYMGWQDTTGAAEILTAATNINISAGAAGTGDINLTAGDDIICTPGDRFRVTSASRPVYNDGADHDLALKDSLNPESTITVTGATGNLGTIDISALACGGTVIIGASATGAHQIEGFTAKPDGFWFNTISNTSQTTQYLNEDATATAANRIRVSGNVDSTAAAYGHGYFVYATSRWRGIVKA